MRAALDLVVRACVVAIILVGSAPVRANECERAPVWRDGRTEDSVCRDEAAERGLTVIDLSDDWVPPVLAPEPDGSGPGYRATYLALAQERFADAGLDGELAARDRYLELYGIEPSLEIVRRRLADEPRHVCHEAVDSAPLTSAPARIAEEPKADAVARIATAGELRAELERDRARKQLADLDALAASEPQYRRAVSRLQVLESYVNAVRAAQAHLACDDLFEARPIDGGYTWQTANAIERFKRGAMVLPSGVLDEQTRAALAQPSRQRDFVTALRVLRARVVAATGLIEDGTAGSGEATVLGLSLEPESTWRVRGHEPLDGAAPDLVSEATEAAARAIGWQDASTTLASLEVLAAREMRFVAIALPRPPPYHSPAMVLAVEIDRGDVWYDAVVHLRDENGELADQGIWTHGTGNLLSLAHGVSHGCHRLLGMHVVRLAGFVLAHRDHAALGDEPTYYRRVVRYGGAFPVSLDTLGYRIELTPPIPVEVLPGRIHR